MREFEAALRLFAAIAHNPDSDSDSDPDSDSDSNTTSRHNPAPAVVSINSSTLSDVKNTVPYLITPEKRIPYLIIQITAGVINTNEALSLLKTDGDKRLLQEQLVGQKRRAADQKRRAEAEAFEKIKQLREREAQMATEAQKREAQMATEAEEREEIVIARTRHISFWERHLAIKESTDDGFVFVEIPDAPDLSARNPGPGQA